MKREFITVDGLVSVDKKWLSQKKLKQENGRNLIYRSGVGLLILLIIYTIHEIIEENNYILIIQVALIITWLIPSFKDIYNLLFVESWRSAIRLDEIISVSEKSMGNTLETQVILQLKNGRRKIIFFRNAENQYEEFILAIRNSNMVVQ